LGVEVRRLVVLDRCTDRTEEVCKRLHVETVRKDWRGSFESPLTEAVGYAFTLLGSGPVFVVDADMRVPRDALVKLYSRLNEDPSVACVSPVVKTRAANRWLNLLFRLRDWNYKVAPLGRWARGGCLLIRNCADAAFNPGDLSWDSALQRRFREAGLSCEVHGGVEAVEFRAFTLKRIVRRQVMDGRARRRLRVGFLRTLAHAVFRGRPFVLWGYLHG
ncbi:MAG: glycosyltransferase family 2 protein, partial [Thermoproteota archaeon]